MKKRVVTISRKHGSGGRTIGHMLEERLGIKCYDQHQPDICLQYIFPGEDVPAGSAFYDPGAGDQRIGG